MSRHDIGREALIVAANRTLQDRAWGATSQRVIDVSDMQAKWDDGENYDPTYGDSTPRLPVLEISLECQFEGPLPSTSWVTLDTGTAIAVLLKAMAGIE